MELPFLQRPPARFVFAFQVALALVITYWLTLSFDWERPKWAAFAVITIAVPHVGMSLSRAGQRMMGTLVGATVALFIIALFPQDRWLFMLALSLWLAACTYMMGFSQRSYFWHCAGFICGIITMTAANTGGNSFMLVVDRTLETSLGILVYTLVTLMVWRVRPAGDPPPSTVPELFFPDAEQLTAALRVFAIYWLAFLAVVYIPDFPTGLSFMAPLAPFVMSIAATPQLPVQALHRPVALALLLASVLYMFVMPQLSGFFTLGTLIFLFGFLTAYRFYEPQQVLARLLVLAVFAALTGINNDQAYSFAVVSNNILVFSLVLLLLHVATVIPIGARPEARVPGLVRRFERSARWLANPPPGGTWLARWRAAHHRHELKTIPARVQAWVPRLSPMLDETGKASVEALLQELKECQEKILTAGKPDATAIPDLVSGAFSRLDWPVLQQPRF